MKLSSPFKINWKSEFKQNSSAFALKKALNETGSVWLRLRSKNSL